MPRRVLEMVWRHVGGARDPWPRAGAWNGPTEIFGLDANGMPARVMREIPWAPRRKPASSMPCLPTPWEGAIPELWRPLQGAVNAAVLGFGGSTSAEHGSGLIKREALVGAKSGLEGGADGRDQARR